MYESGGFRALACPAEPQVKLHLVGLGVNRISMECGSFVKMQECNSPSILLAYNTAWSCFSLIASYRRFTSCNVKSYPSCDNSNRQAEMSAGRISLIAIVMLRSLIPIYRHPLGPEARGTNPRRATNRSHPPGGYHGAATSRQFHDPDVKRCKSVAYRRITRTLEIDESRPA